MSFTELLQKSHGQNTVEKALPNVLAGNAFATVICQSSSNRLITASTR